MGLEGGVGRSKKEQKMIAACKAGFGLGGKPVASSPAPLLHTPAALPSCMHDGLSRWIQQD